MRIPKPQHESGIAMIIVMLVIVVLSVLAGGFAYSMKVETKLARNTSWESDMEWLGRSGVELGKYALAMQLTLPPPESMYTGLNQFWAGAPPNPTNEVFFGMSLKDVPLGAGKFTVSIVDMERKFNLSAITEANPIFLDRALKLIGADSADIPVVIDSYLDWIDNDKGKTHLDGAETDDYLNSASPYCAKNGPVDDIRELLLIKGMTPQIFWGTARVGEAIEVRSKSPLRRAMSPYLQSLPQNQSSGVGLVDLFTPISGQQQININTASAEVLQLIEGVDVGMAQAIVQARNGPDGQPSTEDDIPFINIRDALSAIPEVDPAIAGVLQRFCAVHSRVFEITVDAEIGNYKRRFVALVNRANRTDVQTLYFTWK